MNLVREEVEKRIRLFGSVYAMSWGKKKHRQVRDIVSEFSERGEKILIPVYGNQMYTDVELLEIEQVERYVQSQINHIRNQYRSKVKPLNKYIKDKKLQKLMGTLESVMEEN